MMFTNRILLLTTLGFIVPQLKGQNIACLQTEHLDNPLGIDTTRPRLSWRMEDARDGAAQKNWRIIVGTDSMSVANGQGDAWDSGLQPGSPSLARYMGRQLAPFTTYWWRVDVTNDQGTRLTSPVARFETGMMSQDRWQGCWIDDGRLIDFLPAPYFRKAFQVEKPIRRARLYIAAAGLYELRLNGQRVGDHMLDPLYTRFDRRNLYGTHDVTALLRQGRNAVGVVLGNGWYNHQSLGVWDFERAPWRGRPTFCMDLRITYEDGTETVVRTDPSWRSSTGEVVQNNIYTGEHRDFGRAKKGWDQPDFDEKGWRGIHLRAVPSLNVTAQQARPIRADEERKPVAVKQLNDSVRVYDFGQNMAGIVHLTAQGPKGTRLRLRHAERLHDDGSVDQSNIDVYFRGDREKDPFQTDVVYLSGERDDYTTQFGYKGFRYVQLEMSPGAECSTLDLTARFVHSDVPQAGSIETDNTLIRGLMHASRMSYLSNLMGLPTDCPQREKNGWTGDGHLAIEAGLFNFDGITVYEKWMADHRDEQQPNGVLPDIIPTGGWGYGTDNGLDWTSTIALIPWTLYVFYGDDQALRDCYENIRRYVNYVDRNYPGHLTTWGRGDWVPVSVGSNKELTSSVYFYTDARILARAAEMFGRDDDALRYGKLAEGIREAINRKFLNREEGIYASGTQTELSVPLYWGVVPDECREAVARRLNEKVVAADYHLDVGVLGCKALLGALSQNGYAETAYRVAVQDTYPSWGWWVRNGSTTLLENWNLEANRDVSDNHMMFGEIGAWFYKGLGGIMPDEDEPGFRHIRLSPYFPSDLKTFRARHTSPYGEIESGWERRGRRITYTAIVPPSCHATLTLPDGTRKELRPGRHEIKIKE